MYIFFLTFHQLRSKQWMWTTSANQGQPSKQKMCKYICSFVTMVTSVIHCYNQKGTDSSLVPNGTRNPTVLSLLCVLVTLTEWRPHKVVRMQGLKSSRVHGGKNERKKKRSSGTWCVFTDLYWQCRKTELQELHLVRIITIFLANHNQSTLYLEIKILGCVEQMFETDSSLSVKHWEDKWA